MLCHRYIVFVVIQGHIDYNDHRKFITHIHNLSTYNRLNLLPRILCKRTVSRNVATNTLEAHQSAEHCLSECDAMHIGKYFLRNLSTNMYSVLIKTTIISIFGRCIPVE